MRFAPFSNKGRIAFVAALMLGALALSTATSAADSSGLEAEIAAKRKELDRAERLSGPSAEATGLALLDLAEVYRKLGQNAEAETLLNRSLSIYDRLKSPDPVAVAKVLNNLALIYIDQGKPREAVPLFQSAVGHAYGHFKTRPNHPMLMTLIGNLAGTYALLGNSSEAQPLYGRLVSMSEAAYGPEDKRTQEYRSALSFHTQRLAQPATPSRSDANGSRSTQGSNSSTGTRVAVMDCEAMKRTVIATKVPPNASVTASQETVMFMTKAILDMIAAGCPTEPGVTPAQIEAERKLRQEQYATAERNCNAVQSGGHRCVPQAHTATTTVSAPPVPARSSSQSQSGVISYDPVTGKCIGDPQACACLPGITTTTSASCPNSRGSSGGGIRTAR